MARTRSQSSKSQSKPVPSRKRTRKNRSTAISSANKTEPEPTPRESESEPETEPPNQPEPCPTSVSGTKNLEIPPEEEPDDSLHFGSPPPVEDERKSEDLGTRKNASGRVPGAANWASWEDMALAKEVRNQELWKFAPRSKEAIKRWKKIPDLIRMNHSSFSRTVEASKAHFTHKLLKEWKDERPDQATGEDVGSDQFSKLMSDLLRLFSDRTTQRAEATETAKSKAAADKLAGEQLRQAALENMYPHNRFTIDVTDSEGASQREKGAQRHTRKRTLADDEPLIQDDDESKSPTKKSRVNNRSKMVALVQERNKIDQVAFEEAREEERERQTTLLTGINRLGDSISQLANTMAEAEARRQAESHTMLKVVEALAQKNSTSS